MDHSVKKEEKSIFKNIKLSKCIKHGKLQPLESILESYLNQNKMFCTKPSITHCDDSLIFFQKDQNDQPQ